jgi:hypothetical protein
MRAAKRVLIPFMEYHAATRIGCSDLLYHWAVIKAVCISKLRGLQDKRRPDEQNKGRQPASKRPKKNRKAIIDENLASQSSPYEVGEAEWRKGGKN